MHALCILLNSSSSLRNQHSGTVCVQSDLTWRDVKYVLHKCLAFLSSLDMHKRNWEDLYVHR